MSEHRTGIQRRDLGKWLPAGYGPISQYNTSPTALREFVRDRARLEKLRDMLSQALGPKPDPNPTGVQGVFPEGRA